MNDQFDYFLETNLLSPGINSQPPGESVYLLQEIYQTKIILCDAVVTLGTMQRIKISGGMSGVRYL